MLKIGLSNKFHNKSGNGFSEFPTYEITPEAFIQHVTSGNAFSVGRFERGHRKKENFISAQIIGLDFDDCVSLEAIENHPYKHFLYFAYETPSHTFDKPKTRAIIILDHPIFDAKEYESIVLGVLRLFDDLKPDVACKDCSRFFYGSDKNYVVFGNTLPLEVARSYSVSTPVQKLPVIKPILNGNSTPYGLKALENELLELMKAGVGSRNNQLNKSAFALSQLVAGGELDGNLVKEKLMKTGYEIGLDASEIRNTINSGFYAGENEPRTAPQIETFGFDDVANKDRFLNKYGENILYVPEWGKWYIWKGTHWEIDNSNTHILRLAENVANSIFDEAKATDDNDKARKLSQWAVTSRNINKLNSMVSLTAVHKAITQDQLDSDPLALGVQNGVIDLRNGLLSDGKPTDYITQQAKTHFDPDAKCPRFLNFITNALSGDVEMIRYVQKLAGYTLTGLSNEKIMMVVYGAKDTGKTLLINVLGALLNDYAKSVNANTLMRTKSNRGGSDATPDIARLKGARLVYCDESDYGASLNAALVKSLTGRSKRVARYLHQNDFEYEPTDKIWLATNFMPNIPTDDMAAWGRVRIIEFKNVVPENKQDKGLQDYIIKNELAGVLNWCLEGCLTYQKEGLAEPNSAKATKESIYSEQDSISNFLEIAEFGDDLWIAQSELYRLYDTFCKVECISYPMGKKRFNEHLKNTLGFGIGKKGNGVKSWLGLNIPHHEKNELFNS